MDPEPGIMPGEGGAAENIDYPNCAARSSRAAPCVSLDIGRVAPLKFQKRYVMTNDEPAGEVGLDKNTECDTIRATQVEWLRKLAALIAATYLPAHSRNQ